MDTAQPLITCKNCGKHFIGKFCNTCGEKAYTEKDKSVLHLFSEGLHFITHLDGSFFNTLKALITRPGKFSLDYCNGIRKKYFKPLGFFLMLVIIYLLFPFYQGLNMNLYSHTHHDVYGGYAMRKTIELIQAKHLADGEIGQTFHHTSEKISKFLLFIIIPFMALFSWLMGFKKRKYYFDNFIFCTEAASFFILWGALILPLIDATIRKVFSVTLFSDPQTGIIVISVFTIYLMIASKRFFNFKWWYNILYSLLFSFVLAFFIQFIYNFILFYITIHFI
ncbi:MAG: DUF3667 domain-containing protein [Ferruginibacter sp.]